MNALFTRISTISVILLVCVCNALEVKADKSDEYFLLEAKLSKKTMRSSAPQQEISPLRVDCINGEITLAFNQPMGQVTIKVYNEMMQPVYVKYVTNPQVEYVFIGGKARGGKYCVQVTAGTKTYTEYVLVE